VPSNGFDEWLRLLLRLARSSDRFLRSFIVWDSFGSCGATDVRIGALGIRAVGPLVTLLPSGMISECDDEVAIGAGLVSADAILEEISAVDK